MANIEIELTPKERALILRYGYPFDQIKQALMAVSSSKQVETGLLDEFEVDKLIGDLCRSINHDKKADSPCNHNSMTSAIASNTLSKPATANSKCSEPIPPIFPSPNRPRRRRSTAKRQAQSTPRSEGSGPPRRQPADPPAARNTHMPNPDAYTHSDF